MQQLVDFHPSARKKIADILPTIKPSQPSTVVISSKSKYFEEEVEWCRYFLSDQRFHRRSSMSGAVCTNVGRVLEDADDHIRNAVQEFDKGTNDPACTEGEYYIDAAIAILEIGLLLIERTERLAGSKHLLVEVPCPCQVAMRSPALDDLSKFKTCPVRNYICYISQTFRVVSPFDDGFRWDYDSGGNDSEDDEPFTLYWKFWKIWKRASEKEGIEEVIRDWVIAVGYATSDGSPHAIRSVILSYVDLPSMLPHLGPNDEPQDIRPRWLFDAIRAVDEILLNMRIPERKMEALPDVAGMSI